MAKTNLPNKRARDLEHRLDACEAETLIAMEVREVLRGGGQGRMMRIGGMWSAAARRYVGPIPADWEPRRHFKAGPNQYQVLLDFFDAMGNDDRAEAGIAIIQDILIHGGRRSGKSSALAPAGAMAMIMWPGSLGLIIGPVKRHGDRIMGMIRRVMDPSMWTYDRRDASFRMANTSSVSARNAGNWNNEVGDGLRWMIIDEAATLPEIVYEKLSPSLYDCNGVCCMATTPRGHNWVQKKSVYAKAHPDGYIRDHTFPAADNVFLSQGALRRIIEAAETMSKNAYLEDVLGEYVPDQGIAFGDFSDDNIRRRSEMTKDVTAALCDACFHRPFKFIAAVDFNFEPTIGTILKFDDLGRPWIQAEISVSGGATDKWGHALADQLRALGSTDPTADCIIIADASGDYQGTGKNAPEQPPTWRALERQGWILETPTGQMRQNPSRRHRLELIRSLVCSAKGDRRVFVDPDCTAVIDMFRNLPIKNGLPDRKNQNIHTYDGATYGIYRIWGTGDGELYFGFELVQGLDDYKEIA